MNVQNYVYSRYTTFQKCKQNCTFNVHNFSKNVKFLYIQHTQIFRLNTQFSIFNVNFFSKNVTIDELKFNVNNFFKECT